MLFNGVCEYQALNYDPINSWIYISSAIIASQYFQSICWQLMLSALFGFTFGGYVTLSVAILFKVFKGINNCLGILFQTISISSLIGPVIVGKSIKYPYDVSCIIIFRINLWHLAKLPSWILLNGMCLPAGFCHSSIHSLYLKEERRKTVNSRDDAWGYWPVQGRDNRSLKPNNKHFLSRFLHQSSIMTRCRGRRQERELSNISPNCSAAYNHLYFQLSGCG